MKPAELERLLKNVFRPFGDALIEAIDRHTDALNRLADAVENADLQT